MTSNIPRRSDQPAGVFAAILLAAGASSRMGSLKPLLPLAGITALERSIGLFRSAGIADIFVVLGNRAEELRPTVERCGAQHILNARFADGMFSSVVAGVRALPARAGAAFVLPADVPLVRPATVRQLSAAFLAQSAAIAYPVFAGRRGHPPLIARDVLFEILRHPGGPLSAVLSAHEDAALDVPVADEAIHLDMDTPADFEALSKLAAQHDIPSPAECDAILAARNLPAPVVAHSRKVAEVAGRIADALVARGLRIDPGLARAGGLLHDLAKGAPQHAEAGAEILRGLDMPAVAAVVEAHTEMLFAGSLDERAIVYLADKLVRGTTLVSLDERFQPALDRFHDNPEALASARRRKAVAERIARAIEAALGTRLFAMLRDEAAHSLNSVPAVSTEVPVR